MGVLLCLRNRGTESGILPGFYERELASETGHDGVCKRVFTGHEDQLDNLLCLATVTLVLLVYVALQEMLNARLDHEGVEFGDGREAELVLVEGAAGLVQTLPENFERLAVIGRFTTEHVDVEFVVGDLVLDFSGEFLVEFAFRVLERTEGIRFLDAVLAVNELEECLQLVGPVKHVFHRGVVVNRSWKHVDWGTRPAMHDSIHEIAVHLVTPAIVALELVADFENRAAQNIGGVLIRAAAEADGGF